MRRLLLIALLSSACHFSRPPAYAVQVIYVDAVEDLESGAATELRCPDDEVDSRQLTLLTREVSGCGHQRVYAWDPLHEEWVLDTVEQP